VKAIATTQPHTLGANPPGLTVAATRTGKQLPVQAKKTTAQAKKATAQSHRRATPQTGHPSARNTTNPGSARQPVVPPGRQKSPATDLAP
jgi:hypothetical protein